MQPPEAMQRTRRGRGQRRSRAGVALLALLFAAPARAGDELEMPPALRGRLHVAVVSCVPHPQLPGLRVATVRIASAASEVALPALRCGAFAPGSDRVLFLAPLAGGERLAPHGVLEREAIFPADAVHTECRCVLADVLRLGPPGPGGAEWRERAEGEPGGAAPAPEDSLAPPPERGAPPGAPAVPRLRRELVLRPDVPVRASPDAASAALGALPAGSLVDVLAVAAGWKRVRLPDGRMGWIPDDTATADLLAPQRVGSALRALYQRLAETPPEQRRCQALPDDALRSLVFALVPDDRTAYVSALWYALDERERDAFHVWASDCFGVTRIVEAGSGAELRSLAWGDVPRIEAAPR